MRRFTFKSFGRLAAVTLMYETRCDYIGLKLEYGGTARFLNVQIENGILILDLLNMTSVKRTRPVPGLKRAETRG